MPYTRVQLRRGTLAEWTENNPVLADGEIGLETSSGWFKFGNGLSNWEALPWFQPTDAIVSTLTEGAPVALNTFAELAQAINNNPDILSVLTPIDSPSFTGTVDFSNAVVSGVMLPINWQGEYSDLATYLESDMVMYNGSAYYATGPNINSTNGYFPTSPGADWELFASRGDQGIQGPSGTITVGTVTARNDGQAFVTNVGTPQNAVLNFELPKGQDGLIYPEIVTVTGNTTIDSSYAGKLVMTSGTAAITLTIGSLNSGEKVDFLRYGTGEVTISNTVSAGLRNKLAEQYSGAMVVRAGTANVLMGDLKL